MMAAEQRWRGSGLIISSYAPSQSFPAIDGLQGGLRLPVVDALACGYAGAIRRWIFRVPAFPKRKRMPF
jgi:hypothetical protein